MKFLIGAWRRVGGEGTWRDLLSSKKRKGTARSRIVHEKQKKYACPSAKRGPKVSGELLLAEKSKSDSRSFLRGGKGYDSDRVKKGKIAVQKPSNEMRVGKKGDSFELEKGGKANTLHRMESIDRLLKKKLNRKLLSRYPKLRGGKNALLPDKKKQLLLPKLKQGEEG